MITFEFNSECFCGTNTTGIAIFDDIDTPLKHKVTTALLRVSLTRWRDVEHLRDLRHMRGRVANADMDSVDYKSPIWRDKIITYISEAYDKGFAGVYLTDLYDNEDIKDFVIKIRKINDYKLVVPQDAEDLLFHRDYREAIHGIGITNLFFNSTKRFEDRIQPLKTLDAALQVVLNMEFSLTPDQVNQRNQYLVDNELDHWYTCHTKP